MQLEELLGGNDTARELIVATLRQPRSRRRRRRWPRRWPNLTAFSDTELPGLHRAVRAFGYPSTIEAQDSALSARGYRAMADIPRLQFAHVDPGAPVRLLQDCWRPAPPICSRSRGIGAMWARHVREGLSQLAESTIAEPLVLAVSVSLAGLARAALTGRASGAGGGASARANGTDAERRLPNWTTARCRGRSARGNGNAAPIPCRSR